MTPDGFNDFALDKNTRSKIEHILASLRRDGDAQQAWSTLVQSVLTPAQPFSLHQHLLQLVTQHWDADSQGPFPLWVPSHTAVQLTNLAMFMQRAQLSTEWATGRTGDAARDLPLLHHTSCMDPEVFWPPVLAQLNLRWHQPPDRILRPADRVDDVQWLPGARFNIAESVLCGDADLSAVLWATEDAPEAVHRLSLGQLRRRCANVAASLWACGFSPGDAIAVDMPMTVESVVAFLGTILAGCVVVCIADSFSAAEISSRMRIAGARAIFTQDVVMRGGKAHPLFSRVAEGSRVPAIVVPLDAAAGLQVKLRPGDVSWEDFLLSGAGSAAQSQPHVAGSVDTCCILFSSGTTGEPKAIPWTHVTPIRCGTDAWANHDLRKGDVAAWPTNLGWMMGPWLVFASLLNRSAMALFQGALGRPFGQFVSAAGVTMLGVVPSIVRAWRHTDCMAGLAWEDLRCYSSTGEASSPQDYHWLMVQTRYRCPVIEYCGGTELGGGYVSGNLLQPQSPGTFSTPTLGANLCLLLPDGRQSPHSSTARPATGELAIVPPMLGSSQRLLNRDHHEAYFEGMPRLNGGGVTLRKHGDEIQRMAGGYFAALGRADDTMNLGGIKVSSVDLERVCNAASDTVADTAALAVPRPGGGPSYLVLFVVPKAGAQVTAQTVHKTCQAAIRQQLNPLFKVDRVVLRETLPRTASNKVMRRVLRDELLAAQQTAVGQRAKL